MPIARELVYNMTKWSGFSPNKIEVGHEYAIRRARYWELGSSVRHVEVLRPHGLPRRWEIRYLDTPESQATDMAFDYMFLAPWAEREKLLQDELSLRVLLNVSRKQCFHSPTGPEATQWAIQFVLSAVGADSDGGALASVYRPFSIKCSQRPSGWIPVGNAQQVAAAAGLVQDPQSLDPVAFYDRRGTLHLPFEGGRTLARAVASANREAVLRHIEQQKEVYHHEQHVPAQALSFVREWATAQLSSERLPILRDDADSAVVRMSARLEEVESGYRRHVLHLTQLLNEALEELRSRGAVARADEIASRMSEQGTVNPPEKA